MKGVDKVRNDMTFFRTEKGKTAYNKHCLRCINSCKQSFRVELISCPRYKRYEKIRKKE